MSPFGFGIFGSVFFLIAALWLVFTVVLKGYALWNAAKLGKVWWFIALLVFNTLGILELVYIVFFLKNGRAKLMPRIANTRTIIRILRKKPIPGETLYQRRGSCR